MKREFIFFSEGKEIVLPITPSEYEIERGTNVEIVNIHELGDAALIGYGTLATIKITCLFPAGQSGLSAEEEPQYYVDTFIDLVDNRRELRFIVSDTGINISCFLQSFQYGEKDGTNDVYATITLRERRDLEVVTTIVLPTENAPRASAPQIPEGEITYTAKYGDTLCSICRQFYGNDKPDTYNRLAQYNGKANPNLLMTGEVLKIPRPLPVLTKQTQKQPKAKVGTGGGASIKHTDQFM